MENDKSISFIKKIGKTLLKNGAEFDSKSDASNSVYYKIGGVKVRVSDHFSAKNFSECINIVCSTNCDSVIVCVRNNPIVYKGIREVNLFIRTFCDYARCESKGLFCIIDTNIAKRSDTLNKIKGELCNKIGEHAEYQKLCTLVEEKKKELDIISKTIDTIGVIPEDLNFSNLNDRQKKSIVSMMKSFVKQNKKKASASVKK